MDFNGDLNGDLMVISWDVMGIYPLVICYIAMG